MEGEVDETERQKSASCGIAPPNMGSGKRVAIDSHDLMIVRARRRRVHPDDHRGRAMHRIVRLGPRLRRGSGVSLALTRPTDRAALTRRFTEPIAPAPKLRSCR